MSWGALHKEECGLSFLSFARCTIKKIKETDKRQGINCRAGCRLHCNFNAVFCRLFDLLSNYFLWSAPLGLFPRSGFIICFIAIFTNISFADFALNKLNDFHNGDNRKRKRKRNDIFKRGNSGKIKCPCKEGNINHRRAKHKAEHRCAV